MSQKTPLQRVLFAHCLKWVGLGVFALGTIFCSLLFTLNKPTSVVAATSSTLNFQARLMNTAGAIVPDGTYNIQFKLYDAASGGSNLWTESYTATSGAGGTDARVRVANGYLSVPLGSITSFPDTIDWSQDLYLTMNIGGTGTGSFPGIGDGEMSPRIHLTAVPYAFKAGQAAQLASGTSTLSFTNPSNSNTIALPDASGTVCLQNASACGFAASSGSGSYIQNGTGLQNANFAITNNAGTAGVTALIQQSSGQTGDLLRLQNSSGASIATFSPTGAVAFQTTTDSTTAFQVINSGNTKILAVDTVNNLVRVTVGTIINSSLTSGTGALQIGADNADNLALDDNEIMARSNGGTGTLYVQKLGGGLQVQAATTVFKPSSDSSTAFQIQKSSNSARIFGVDTSGSQALFGQGSTLAGKVVFYNATNNNTISIQSGTTSASYTLTMPTALGSSGDCLKDTTGTGVLGWGACGTGGGGGGSTLQNAYDNSGTTSPQIALSTTNGGIKIQDAVGGVSGNLFQIQNSSGTTTYFGLSTTALTMQDTSGNTIFVLNTSTGHLQVKNAADSLEYADIYYDSVNNEAVFTASPGSITRIGNGSGNITLQLTGEADLLQATKSGTLTSAYSGNDFSFTRNITAGANALTGSVVKIESTSSGSSTKATNILWLNENTTGSTGNLILATTNGAANEKFKVDLNGSITVAAGQAISSVSGSLGVTAGSGDLTLTASGANKVVIKPGTNSASSFEVQNSGGTVMMSADTSNGRIQIGTASGNAVATLLVLDGYNQSSDPSGANGAMYYNTNMDKFRCYQNSAWKDCITSLPVATRAASDTANTTSLAADATGMSFSLAANTKYHFKFVIIYQSSTAATGIGFGVTTPTSPTTVNWCTNNMGNSGGAQNVATTSWGSVCGTGDAVTNAATGSVQLGGVSFEAVMEGYIETSANSGTLQLRFLKEAVATGTVTVKAGSFGVLTPVQ